MPAFFFRWNEKQISTIERKAGITIYHEGPFMRKIIASFLVLFFVIAAAEEKIDLNVLNRRAGGSA